MKYKINQATIEFPSKHDCVGLFSYDSKWEGRGNFCGWYGIEYYIDGTLIAYYEIDKQMIWSPKGHKHLSEVVCNKKFKEMMISSCYWEVEIEADNDEEAIKKFFSENF